MILKPSKLLESTIQDIESIFAGLDHWTCFGALWGLIRNRGTIPDGDFDVCVFYGQDWNEIENRAASSGYKTKKVMVNNADRSKALFMGIFKGDMYICVSFWYPFENYYLWCHDNSNEIKDGVGIPQSGYFFKGCEKWLLSKFVQVEWPGVIQNVKITVPLFSGSLLDLCYPGWPYLQQRYVIQNYQVDESKSVSINDPTYHKGSTERAFSRYQVHVKSMEEFNDHQKIGEELQKNSQKWDDMIKSRKI